ncbi:MAG: transketolase C-terminal domain-containing protein, partial [Porcipelethomonas sp.]
VIHVNTVKGKGYLPAEKNPGEFHGISKFDIMTGNPEVSSSNCYSTCFGRELVRLAEADENICAVTAAMKYGTGLQYFAAEYSDRFFDVGIAEQHAVTFSAGLASMGKLPVFAVYSSFLQRAVDQLIHDVAIGKNHVVIAVDRAGIVGEDGETHQGVFDIPIIASIPGAVIYSPSCYEELKMCMKAALYDCDGLVCVRYPRGRDTSTFDKLKLNTSYTFIENQGSDILMISYGRIYDNMFKAYKQLNIQNIKCDILKLTRVMPIDKEVFEKAAKYRRIVFFEESILNGSVSEYFSRELLEYGFNGRFFSRGVTGFVKQASVDSILEKLGLDSDSMVDFVKQITEQKNEN